MEKISKDKFESLSQVEMSNINGGGLWIRVKTKEGEYAEYTQEYNWFGLHATGVLD